MLKKMFLEIIKKGKGMAKIDGLQLTHVLGVQTLRFFPSRAAPTLPIDQWLRLLLVAKSSGK